MTEKKPKRGDQFRNLEVADMAPGSGGVVKHDGFVWFVKDAIPGDIVNIEIQKRKRNFGRARMTKLVAPSPSRLNPFCKHFEFCGGCRWQHVEYAKQIKYKQKIVVDAFTRIGKLPIDNLRDIIGSEKTTHYRNKLEYSFGTQKWYLSSDSDDPDRQQNGLGFHVGGRFDKILEIEECWLQKEPSNAIRNFVGDKARELGIPFYDIRKNQGVLRNLLIRSTKDGQVLVGLIYSNGHDKLEELLESLINQDFKISSLYAAENNKKNDSIADLEFQHLHGAKHLTEKLTSYDGDSELKFRISPQSFFQTNPFQTEVLYKTAADFAGIKDTDLVYDLYCGTGSITNYVASAAKKVIGVEYVEEAVKDAASNSELNKVYNAEYFAGDMSEVLDATFWQDNGKPDVIIADPPRSGMHPAVIDRLIESEAEKIVYVSCNPATQSRDLEILCKHYAIEAIQPIDMFPHTWHVENVVSLKKI